jgi:hypothetical protein
MVFTMDKAMQHKSATQGCSKKFPGWLQYNYTHPALKNCVKNYSPSTLFLPKFVCSGWQKFIM